MSQQPTVLARDGHLSALAIDRYLYDRPAAGLEASVGEAGFAAPAAFRGLATTR